MNSPTLRFASTAVASLAAMAAGILLAEAANIRLLATPAEITQYHFGSESTLANGGPAYASPDSYIHHLSMNGLYALVLSVIAGLVASRATRQDGQLVLTWALRTPAYAWLSGAMLFLGLAIAVFIDPTVTIEAAAETTSQTIPSRALPLLALGLTAGATGLVAFGRYSRLLRIAG